MACCIGFDVGGTNLKAALIERNGQIIVEHAAPTPDDLGADGVIDAMVQMIRSLCQVGSVSMDRVIGIGVGTPGALDFEAGVVINAPNVAGWVDLPLRDRLCEAMCRPVIVENDANVAAYGEYSQGAGRDPSIKNLVMVTVGTGVGSGMVVAGRILHGGFGMGGETGHMIVEPQGRLCGCGQHGCLEAYASATSVAKRTIEAIEQGESSSLQAVYQQKQRRINSQDVFEAAEAGDALAGRIADETARYLGICCVNLYRLLDPQMIVFAGGLAQAGDPLFSRVHAAIEQYNWTIVPARAPVVPSQLGLRSGVIGAAALAWDHFGQTNS